MKLKPSLLLLFLLLIGCTTQIQLSPQDAKQIHTIAIDPQIGMPNEMYFHGDGAQFAAALGFLGQILSMGIVEKDINIIQCMAKENHISLEQTLTSKIKQRINQATHYRVTTKKSDAILKLNVTMYGFTATKLGFSSKLAPMMSVEIKLMNGNRTIWQNSITACGTTDILPSYSMDQIAGDPRFLNHMWQELTNIIAFKLTQKFN